MGPVKGGVDLQRLGIIMDGFFQQATFRMGNTQVVVSLEMVGINTNSLQITLDGPLRLTGLLQSQTEIIVRPGFSG